MDDLTKSEFEAIRSLVSSQCEAYYSVFGDDIPDDLKIVVAKQYTSWSNILAKLDSMRDRF